MKRAPLPYISPHEPDWQREAKRVWHWDPGRSLIASLRAHERASRQKSIFGAVLRRFAVLRHRFWSIVTSADIPLGSRIGGGLLLPHPNGIVVHPEATIGPNCLLFQQVTLGNGGGRPGAPKLAGHVDVGAGAKILGGVTIGEHAKIGANAVVLCDVPARMIAIGVPARVFASADTFVDEPGPPGAG